MIINEEENQIRIIEDFFYLFYHEEPSEAVASTRALEAMNMEGAGDYDIKIAKSFKYVLDNKFPSDTLKKLVRRYANRHVKNDEEARMFIQYVYENNSFDLFHDLDEF